MKSHRQLDFHDTSMTKAILCAVDFSDPSFRALRWAIDMARALGAHLTILNTYRLIQPVNGEGVLMMKKKIEEEARGSFQKIENDMLKGQGISFDFKSEVGFVSDRVEDYARKQKLLFFVVGKTLNTTNREGLSELIEQTTVPLVIVP